MSPLVGENRFDLRFERLGVERLDDVIAGARLLGRDHVLGLRFGRHHDERRPVEPGSARISHKRSYPVIGSIFQSEITSP